MQGINPKDFEAMREQSDYLFVDVRTPHEVAMNRIAGVPNRVNVPLDKVRECELDCDKDKMLITACQIDLRGYEAEVMLRAKGYTNVKSLEGGMSGWPYATESDRK